MPKRTAKLFSLEGKSVGKVELPAVFATPLRPDVIKRAVLAIQSGRIQPQGRDPMAGKKTTAESRGTGSGIARIPRMKTPGGRAAFAPGTVKGRAGHPPISEKMGYKVHALARVSELVRSLHSSGNVSREHAETVLNYVKGS